MAAPDLDELMKAVMASFNQPEQKAVDWISALADSLVSSKGQLMGLLKADRTEKEAGRGGSSAWRVVISALGQASISEAAWPVLEAKLIEFLDKDGPAAAPATAPRASPRAPPAPPSP